MKRYFINRDVLFDFLICENYFEFRKDKLESFEFVRQSCEYVKNILKEEDSICIVSEYSLISIYLSFIEKEEDIKNKIAILIRSLQADESKWIVINENEEIINKAICYSEDKDINYNSSLQYFCAIFGGCDAIITNDLEFSNFDIEVLQTKK